jgi:hypothetical protein
MSGVLLTIGISSLHHRLMMHSAFVRLIVVFLFMAALFLFLIPQANIRYHDAPGTSDY